MTRRLSREKEKEKREKEELEKAKELAAAPVLSTSSASSSSLPDEKDSKMDVHDDKAEVKASSSDTSLADAAAAKKAAAAAAAKAKRAAAKVKAKEKAIKDKEDANATASIDQPVGTSLPSPTRVRAAVMIKRPPTRGKMKRSDPSQCLEIVVRMYEKYYEQEELHLIKPYMSSQKDINNRMRGILVDWLVEVHYKFRLQTPTLWLCINLLDRYLERMPLMRNRLQLLGVTCLFVACKFEEIYPPEVRDCVYITDNAYSREDVLTMEQSILSVLDYQLCRPTGYHFLTRYLYIIHASEKTRHLAFYYAERNLQEPILFNHKPSQLMSAALYAALAFDVQENCRYESDDEENASTLRIWPDLLIEETGFDESDLLPIAKVMLKHVSEEPVTTSMRHLIAAKKKYLNDKFFNVAELPLPAL